MRASLLLAPSRSEAIHQPRRRNDEQRREEEPEQGVQPNERDIEAAEAESDPQCSKRTMTFQENAPDGCDWTGSIVMTIASFQTPRGGLSSPDGYLETR